MREHPNQFTLGQLIDELEGVSDKTKGIRFDFCSLVPIGLDSYRGYYEDLAIGWSPDTAPTVGLLLEYLKAKLGSTVHGWKGGKYTVSRDQLLFVANPGETGSTVIVGVDSTYFVILRTVCTEGDS